MSPWSNKSLRLLHINMFMYKFTYTLVTRGESRWICHVIENKHGDKCLQNLKHNGDLGNIRRFRCPKLLFVGAKGFV